MPQNERLRVWKGDLKKTSGGLTKAMLMKNKRGKIVSKAKSEAAKKNKENNLGQWLRSKGEQFLSKGLKQENIVRKNKAGRKAFKQKEDDIPEEKQSEVKKKPPKSGTKQKKKAPPKITKTAPMKPGEKPKDRTKISVGNITRSRESRKAIKEYTEEAKELMEESNFTKKQVIAELGKPPEGFKW